MYPLGFYFLDPSSFLIPQKAVLSYTYVCISIYVYLGTQRVAVQGKKGKKCTRRHANFCNRAAVTPVMITGWDASAWPATLPKMTEDAMSGLSQPYALMSDKTNHIPGYVSWNVAIRSEVSSLLCLAEVRPHLEYYIQFLVSLFKRGVGNLERLLWRWP